MGKNIIQINGGMTINVDASVKNVMYVKKIIFGILLHVVVKMENIQEVLWMIQQLRVMKLQKIQFEQILMKNNEVKETMYY